MRYARSGHLGITLEGLFLLASTLAGIVALAIGFEQFSFYRTISKPFAAVYLVVAFITLLPSITASVIGMACLALLLAWEWMHRPVQAVAT